MNCAFKLIKILMFVFNLVFFLTGLLLLVFGALGLASKKLDAISEALDDRTSILGLSIGVLLLGFVVMVIAFLGCCGAYKENNCMLMTFAGILVVIFIAEITVGIVAFVKRDSIMYYINNNSNFKTALLKGYYEGDDQDTFRTAWDELQRKQHCCGFDRATDWIAEVPSSATVPQSCCADNFSQCVYNNAHKEGCKDAIIKLLESQMYMFAIGGVIFAVIQIVAIVFACCLAKDIRHGKGSVV